MIIKFATTTIDPRNEELTYWFSIRLPGYEYTSIDVGLSREGALTNASRNFLDLEKQVQEKALTELQSMLPKVV